MWSNAHEKRNVLQPTKRTYAMTTIETTDNRTKRPNVPTADQTPCPTKHAHAHPAVVYYRLFQNSRLDSKTFGVTDEARQAMGDFLHSMGATAELIDGRWVLTDKGQVDYMVVTFVDSEAHAQREAQRILAKQMIANWKAMKAEGRA